MINIEYDSHKATVNLRRHGVSFEDAKTVFLDPYAITNENLGDYGEIRYETLGMNAKMQVLIVIWTERNGNIRLISAWKADKLRRKAYEHH